MQETKRIVRKECVGYRRWKCFPYSESLELYGALEDSYRWHLGEINNAGSCKISASPWLPTEEHKAPGEGCECGLYAYQSWQDPAIEFARRYPWYHMPRRGYMFVTGVVAISGNVIFGTQRSIRAEKARIIALLNPKVNKWAMQDWIPDDLTFEAILWEEWISSTLPSLASAARVPMIEEQKIPDYITAYNLVSAKDHRKRQ
jgi:hypothetical protein